jgi:hypothetical protein
MPSVRVSGLSFVAVCISLMTLACGGSGGTSPSTTTTTVPATAVTVTSITITGAAAGTATVGEQVALKATANRSDGTTLDVTAQAVWGSSNMVVATVSAAGALAALAAGVTDIRATYSNVSGLLQITVSQRPHLTGIVTDADNNRPLAGVTVQVLDGPNSGRSTQTDDGGAYSLDNLVASSFTVQYAKTSYTTVTRGMTVAGESRVDVSLKIEAPTGPDVSGFYGNFNIGITVTRQSCGEFPVFMDPTGTLELAGRPDGSGFSAKLTERGVSRTYSGGRMNADGSFGGSFTGLVPGLVEFPPQTNHDASGSIQGTVSGRAVNGSESLTYSAPCPGGSIGTSFGGNK